MLTAILVAVSFACHASATPEPEPAPPHPVEASVVLDSAGARPGQAISVGVFLKIREGWHVYWKNPGDAGLPVSIKMTMGPATSPVQIAWPVPVRFDQPGNIVGYGYTGEVLLAVPFDVPPTASVGTDLPLAVDVSWLVCKDVCIPGSASLKVVVPVRGAAAPANESLFATWRSRVPVPVPAVAGTRFVTSGSVDPAKRSGEFVMTASWPAAVSNVAWFPGDDPAVSVANVSSRQTNPDAAEIRFTAEVLAGQQPRNGTLDSVVAYTDTEGNRRGIVVPVRLTEHH